MLILLSPAKTLDFDTAPVIQKSSHTRFTNETETLAQTLKAYSQEALGKLMNLSESLAKLNTERYTNWQGDLPQKQALMAFKGDVYQGLQAENFQAKEWDFAQKHLRILSGLYGLLRPLDLIKPYRLEMGTKLKVDKHKNLYEFWDNKITQLIQQDLQASGSNVLLNLASNEYFKSVKTKNLSEQRIIMPVFKELRGDKYKVISFSAKKARGMMSRYIIEQQIEDVEMIKSFAEDRYCYDESLSDKDEWVFVR